MKKDQLQELLYQALETEKGGIQVYTTALRCVVNDELKEEWEEYLEQTQNHERIVLEVFEKLGLGPDVETDGRKVVRHIGASLVKAMEMAISAGDPAAAQLVAGECIVLAESKDHLNWELIGQWRRTSRAPRRKRSRRHTIRSKTKKTSTSTTLLDGRGSCGLRALGCPRSFLLQKKRRM